MNKHDEKRKGERLRVISFRVDEEILAVLAKLEDAVGEGALRRRRSIAIRRALLEAGERLAVRSVQEKKL